MAILSTWIDKNPGITLAGFTVTTFAHSVNTTPDLTLFNCRSVASNTVTGYACAVGANASLATVLAPSVLGNGAVFGDLWNIYFWNPVR